MNLVVLADDYSVYQVEPNQYDSALRSDDAGVVFVSKTPYEISVIAKTGSISCAIREDLGWQMMYIDEVISLSASGILSNVLQPLAIQEINILAISTFNTDYILFKKERLIDVINALSSKNFKVKVLSHAT